MVTCGKLVGHSCAVSMLCRSESPSGRHKHKLQRKSSRSEKKSSEDAFKRAKHRRRDGSRGDEKLGKGGSKKGKAPKKHDWEIEKLVPVEQATKSESKAPSVPVAEVPDDLRARIKAMLARV